VAPPGLAASAGLDWGELLAAIAPAGAAVARVVNDEGSYELEVFASSDHAQALLGA
jgi:hypothetical protein